MKSLALWYKPKGEKTSKKALAEIHLNIWKLPYSKKIFSKKEFDRFIDIGILLDNADEVDKLYLFYPQELTIEEIEDLGGKIVSSSDKKLINTIFNDNLTIKSNGNSAYHIISDSNQEDIFSIYVLGESHINIKKLFQGSIIEISFGGRFVPKKTYVRIRIKRDYSNLFSHINKPSNSILQSAFSKSEIFDLRINEARELSNELLEHIDSHGSMFDFSKIHFFFICSSREEYMFSHVPFISCRQLEKDRWKDYICQELTLKVILAYHWKVKDDNGIKDFNALVQTRYENNSWKTIVIYLLGICILTFAINLFSNFTYQKITEKGNKPVKVEKPQLKSSPLNSIIK